MDHKLDKIIDELQEIKMEQALSNLRLDHYNQSLDQHIKRTEILEKEVHTLWKWKWMVSGAIIIVSFVLQLIVPLITKG